MIVFDKDEHLADSFFNCWQDVAHEIAGELQANPDLIIGNYSDGNLVACLLAHKMGVTHVWLLTTLLLEDFYYCLLFTANAALLLDMQCTIAHALEKTKYPNSDLYWKKFEDHYHFSCQFTTDLIAMNHADFIITSTFQEIAGKWVAFIQANFADTIYQLRSC